METPQTKSATTIHDRKESIQRRLTQQLLDEGVTRDIAIRHAEITLQIALDGFDGHGKPLPEILKHSILLAIDDYLNSDIGSELDVFNQKNPNSDPAPSQYPKKA
ncbi:MAG: hypothetical protein J0L62_09745 [Bacteroidetes bacterium]|nr:hypothetical protein [Bacteroidota bacterium]